jgi:hypothetical protein
VIGREVAWVLLALAMVSMSSPEANANPFRRTVNSPPAYPPPGYQPPAPAQRTAPPQSPPPSQGAGNASAPPQYPSAAPGEPAPPQRPSPATESLDVVGIRTGMTIDQAKAALKKLSPKIEINEQTGKVSNYGVSTPMLMSLSAKMPTGEVKSSEYVTVEFTAPPTQLVHGVTRQLSKPMIRAEIEESLRRKYGPTAQQTPGGMGWVFDDQGHLSDAQCHSGRRSGKSSKLKSCVGATVSATLNTGPDPSLLSGVTVRLENTPLMEWGEAETGRYLADLKDKKQRETVEKATQDASKTKTQF